MSIPVENLERQRSPRKPAARTAQSSYVLKGDGQTFRLPSLPTWSTGGWGYLLTAMVYFVGLGFYRADKFRSWFLLSILVLLLQASLLFNESLPTPWLPIAIVFVMLVFCVIAALVLWNINEDQEKLIATLKEREAEVCMEDVKKQKVLKTYLENLQDFTLFIVFPLLAGTVFVLGWREWAPKPRWVRGQRNVALDKKIAALVKKAAVPPMGMGYGNMGMGYGNMGYRGGGYYL